MKMEMAEELTAGFMAFPYLRKKLAVLQSARGQVLLGGDKGSGKAIDQSSRGGTVQAGRAAVLASAI